jgi:DNA helicase IV
VRARDVEETLDRTRVQTDVTTERAWAHVTDRARLRAVDGRALDEGTATAHADTFDVEDVAVLFELDRLRAARRGQRAAAPRPYDLLVLDEAQELAPLELALLGRSLAPGGTLVVAGDADQQTDGTTAFLGWEATMAALGASDHERVVLDVGYRCPPPVVALARCVRGTSEDAQPAPGAQTAFLAFADERALAARLGQEARGLARRDPRASLVVVCRAPLTARRLAVALQSEVPARLVFDGRFLSRGPVQVTTVDEVKGLEFDFVVIPDAGARDYPGHAACRRALYVAVTRARHQVVVAWVGEASALLPRLVGASSRPTDASRVS